MFGFYKKQKDVRYAKKQSNLDKVLMGLIVGGAIGSVLGVGLAPKKGVDTRKDVSKQAGKAYHGIRGWFSGIMKKSSSKSINARAEIVRKFDGKNIPDEK